MSLRVGADVYRYAFSGLENRTRYYFKVAAKNDYGIGEFSDVISCIYVDDYAAGGSGGGPDMKLTVMPAVLSGKDTVEISVKAEYNLGLCRLGLFVDYDSEVLEFIEINAGDMIGKSDVSSESGENGGKKVLIDCGKDIAEETGTLFKVKFRVKEIPYGTDGIIPVRIIQDETVSAVNKDGEAFKLECVDGYILAFENAVIPDVSGDGKLDAGDITDIQNQLAGKDYGDGNDIADMDRDDEISMSDLNLIMALIKKIIKVIS